MGEIASAHVSIYPKFAPNFGKDITTQVGAVGKAAGTQMGQQLGDGVAKSAPKIGQGFSSAIKPILTLAAVGAISSFVSSSVASFAELEDATAAAGVVFGDSMGTIETQASGAAQAIGVSKTEAMNAAIMFGTFGKSAGLAGKDLAGFSTEMVQLAGDMASFRGTSPEQAIEAIGAAMRGEAEPIRQYGVLLDEASLKNRALSMGLISTTKDALTPQNKVLAAQAEILAQTSDAQGDFARTSESTANTQKILAAESANLSAEIGEKLAPAMVAAQKAGIGFLKWTSDNLAILAPMATAIGTVALAVGGFVLAAKGIEAVKAARATIVGLGDAFQAMSGKAKAATLAAGGIGIALTVAAGAYGMWAQQQEQAKTQTEAFTESLRADSGALGENTRAAVANQIASAEIVTTAAKMGISADALTDAVMGNSAAYDYVTARMRDYMAANADTEGAITGAKTEMDAINGVLGDMSGRLTQTQANYAAYAAETGKATAATRDGTTAVDANSAALKEQLDAINASAQAQLALSGSQIGLEAAIDGATAAVKKNGQTLDIHTEKGRANRSALNSIASAGIEVAKSYQGVDGGAKKSSDALNAARSSFIKAATQMGLTKKEAEKLATALGLIKSKDITVTAHLQAVGAYRISGTNQVVRWQKIATGGPVVGPGTGTSDSIPAMLSNGEHVLTASEVSRMGGHQAVYRMRAAVRAGGLRFADGGPVGSTRQAAGFAGPSAGDIADAVAGRLNGMTMRLDRIDRLADYAMSTVELALSRGSV